MRAGIVALLVPLLLGARGPRPPRGVPAEDAVAMALEIRLLADPGWEAEPDALDEARRLLRDPDADPATIPDRLDAVARSWAQRSVEAHRRLALETARREGGEEGGTGTLATLARARACADALPAARAAAPGEAEAVFAACVPAPSAVAALAAVGAGLDVVTPVSTFGRARAARWRAVFSAARVPAPAAWGDLPAGEGDAPACPLCGVVRVEPDAVHLTVRPLVSWSGGRLVTDPGPVPERVATWSPEAFVRLRTIAARRAALAFGAVDGASDRLREEPGAPRVAARSDLPLDRLAQVVRWMVEAGVPEPCMLLAGDGTRETCLPWRETAPAPGEPASEPGLLWAVASPDATVGDLVRLAEEARAGGRRLGLAHDAPVPPTAP